MTEIGKKIKELRLEKDLSMDMLVADLNFKYKLDNPINKSMLSRWESGKNDPTLENARYLCMYFDVSLDYMLGLTEVRTPSRLLTYAKRLSEIK